MGPEARQSRLEKETFRSDRLQGREEGIKKNSKSPDLELDQERQRK